MASSADFVQFVVDQIDPAGSVTSKKMFGEYALYGGRKVVALVCDNRLYVKPTEAGRAFAGNVSMAPPYPGAKPSFLIEEQLENRDWLSQLIRLTEQALPEPPPKREKAKKVPTKRHRAPA